MHSAAGGKSLDKARRRSPETPQFNGSLNSRMALPARIVGATNPVLSRQNLCPVSIFLDILPARSALEQGT
jgi:hypothetical protein